MQYTFSHNSKGYSIIVAITMIGFLLILTTSTLNLVLQEMQDGKGKQDYMKAYAGAEGSLELALLQIKQKWYGYYGSLSQEKILWNSTKDVALSYDFDGKVSSYSGALSAFGTDIIPLFWIDETSATFSLSQANLSSSNELVWNIIGIQWGISGTGSFLPATAIGEKKFEEKISGNQDFSFINTTTIESFLGSNSGSYMVVYNPTDITQNYTLQWGGDSFTKPRTYIESSAKIGKYTQNLETLVDNTEFLGILKYSIYSWE